MEQIRITDNIDWDYLSKTFFNNTPYDYQRKIFNAVFAADPPNRKITIRAATRAGKSYLMAETAILKASLYTNNSVGIIAPTYSKTRKIMDYIADLLAANSMYENAIMLTTEGLTKLERLRKEVSKKRITWKNGSNISSISVDLDSKGMALMGSAFQTIIVDETDEIDETSYTKIYRMLVESPDSIMIEIGNPWRLGHFYRHHNDEDWLKFKIPWQDCVKAGRMTYEDVMDQKKNMTDLEFRVLYEAEFPDEIEMAIFTRDAIENLTKPYIIEKPLRILIGVDVARSGRDNSVITVLGASERQACFLESIVMDTRDIMTVAGRTAQIAETFKLKHIPVEISVDTVGVGAGVHDRLRESGYDVQEFIAGSKAHNEIHYYNLKTEVAFKTNEAAKAGLIMNIPPASKYTLQLRSWIYEVRSDRKLKIVDPENKSPDESDSLLMALSRFVYHEDLLVLGHDSPDKPRWLSEKPKNLLKARK